LCAKACEVSNEEQLEFTQKRRGFFWRMALVTKSLQPLDLKSMHPKSAEGFFWRMALVTKSLQPLDLKSMHPKNAESFLAQRSSRKIFSL